MKQEQECRSCGKQFSEEKGFFVYTDDEAYFLCDGCGHASQPNQKVDDGNVCAQCGKGVVKDGVCDSCGAKISPP